MGQRHLTHPPQKRCHGQALHENGEGDYHKRDRNNRFTMRHIGWQSQRQCKREPSPKTSPKQNVLMPTSNMKHGPTKHGTARIDCQRSPKYHK